MVGWGGGGCSVVGWGVVWWLRPILVFSLSLGQAEQLAILVGDRVNIFIYIRIRMYNFSRGKKIKYNFKEQKEQNYAI